MDWIKSLNRAIAYIEDNLLENLSCKDIADQIYISSFHFQRGFSLLTGMSVGEYIRNRRLSLAGQELILSDVKVIDVALKYGYETPESFSKAFSRFHEISPNQARLEGAVLKSFNRLVIKIRLEGGTVMNYQIVNKEAFEVLAKFQTFTSENSQKGIPAFWDEYNAQGLQGVVPAVLGICGKEDKETGEFFYGIGTIYQPEKDIPDGFELASVAAGTWAVFKCVGPMPDAIQNMWERIFSEWLPQADYELVSEYDFEFYTDGDSQSKDYESEIWLPVRKKDSN